MFRTRFVYNTNIILDYENKFEISGRYYSRYYSDCNLKIDSFERSGHVFELSNLDRILILIPCAQS